MDRLKSLFTLTKEGTNLFSEITNNILNLLPGNWGSIIKRVLLSLALIIAVPIVFFILAHTCTIFKLMFWCYKPVISGINFGIKNLGALASSSAVGLLNRARRVPYRRLRETSRVETSVVRYDREPHEAVTLQTPRRPSRAPKSLSKVLSEALRRAADASFSGY